MKTKVLLSLVLALPLFSVGPSLFAQFNDLTDQAGIGNAGRNRGVSIIDVDQDGWEDIYFTRLDGANLLYRNHGDGTYEDIGGAAGVDYMGASGTAVWGDLDNDGWPDLVLGNRRELSRIYRNNGDGTFIDITAGSGIAVDAQVMSVNLADVDQDGWLDIYFANLGEQNALYHNNGDGTFADHTYLSGTLDEGVAMGAIFFDYDQDGDPDLYLTHDANQPNILYQNTGGGIFVDVSRSSGLDLAAQGMGVDVADIDQDGWLDVYITNLYENILFRNQGDGSFENIAVQAGVTDRGMGWGTAFFDFDNDSRPDIYVANETNFGVDYQFYDNILYRNLDGRSFRPITDNEALKSPYGGYGLATADLDQNGRIDLVIANSGEAGNQLLSNQEESDGHWVRIKLEGTKSNRSAIGARVFLKSGTLNAWDEVIAGSGFSGQSSLSLHFGLGNREWIDSLTIYWPSGVEETFAGLSVDQVYSFVESIGLTSTKDLIPFSPFDLKVNPNPTRGNFDLQLNFSASVKKVQFKLYNTYGQIIYHSYEQVISNQSMRKTFELNGKYPAGIYYLSVSSGRQSQTVKIQLTKD